MTREMLSSVIGKFDVSRKQIGPAHSWKKRTKRQWFFSSLSFSLRRCKCNKWRIIKIVFFSSSFRFFLSTFWPRLGYPIVCIQILNAIISDQYIDSNVEDLTKATAPGIKKKKWKMKKNLSNKATEKPFAREVNFILRLQHCRLGLCCLKYSEDEWMHVSKNLYPAVKWQRFQVLSKLFNAFPSLGLGICTALVSLHACMCAIVFVTVCFFCTWKRKRARASQNYL